MSVPSDIITKVRNITNERSKTDSDIRTFTSSYIFTLSEENIIDVTALLINDVNISESGNWSYSSSTNKLTIEESGGPTINSGDTVEIQYSYYPNYSDSEIEDYIRHSVFLIGVHGNINFEFHDDDISPEPTERDKNLIALVAGILMKPDNKSYRLPALTVTVPLNTMPTDEIVRKAIAAFKRNATGVFSLTDI